MKKIEEMDYEAAWVIVWSKNATDSCHDRARARIYEILARRIERIMKLRGFEDIDLDALLVARDLMDERAATIRQECQ